MQVREPRQMLRIEGNDTTKYSVTMQTDLSDHILATGPRYQIEDTKCNMSMHLGENTSGVLCTYIISSLIDTYLSDNQSRFFFLVLGLNAGTKDTYNIGKNRLLRVYHVTGHLGIATENNFKNSRTVAKATFTHVWPDRITALAASIQASHQKKMFELSGVDMTSQTAYDLAVQGPIRPASNRLPVVYGIRCVHFQRPEFKLEIHAINEDEAYLCQLVQEIGLQLHTVAHCTAIRCIRHGHFDVENSLLRNSWNLQDVLTNLERNRKLIAQYPNMLRQRDIRLTAPDNAL